MRGTLGVHIAVKCRKMAHGNQRPKGQHTDNWQRDQNEWNGNNDWKYILEEYFPWWAKELFGYRFEIFKESMLNFLS